MRKLQKMLSLNISHLVERISHIVYLMDDRVCKITMPDVSEFCLLQSSHNLFLKVNCYPIKLSLFHPFSQL